MPVEPTTVSVRNGKWTVPVYRFGSGEPLVFLHAAGGMSRGVTPDLQSLGQSYEVIVPVLPGWDDTEGLQEIDDIHDLMFFLQDFVDAANIPAPFNLMGHSLGGNFAAEFAAARPDLVKKLILVCPAGLWMDETPVADLFSAMPNQLPELLFGDPSRAGEFMKRPENEDELAQQMYMQLANFAAAGKFMWPIPDKGLKKRLHRVKAPTLIVWGDSDRLIPPAYGPLFESKIQKSQLVTIGGAGHMLPLEKQDEFVSEVKGFLG